jgi:hypothetical protein
MIKTTTKTIRWDLCANRPCFENLRIRILNLLRVSTNFIKSGVFRIYFRAAKSIIEFN